MAEYEILVSKIEEINVLLNEIKDKQQELEARINNDYKVIMKRINKLQEYNEISDMNTKITYSQMNELLLLMKSIDEKLY